MQWTLRGVSQVSDRKLFFLFMALALIPFFSGGHNLAALDAVIMTISGVVTLCLAWATLKVVSESRSLYANSISGVLNAIWFILKILAPLLLLLYISLAAALFYIEVNLGLDIFIGDPSRFSVFVFLIDQALKGLFFDVLEVLGTTLPFAAAPNYQELPFMAVFIILFRAAMGGTVVAVTFNIVYHNILAGRKKHLVNMKIHGKEMVVNVENIIEHLGGRENIARQFLEQSTQKDGIGKNTVLMREEHS